jgi:predicted alpha/beta hydrolase
MQAQVARVPTPLPSDGYRIDGYAIDGEPLVMRYVPAIGPLRGAVLLAPAMGVPQRFYQPFAAWLSSIGFATLSFDYRSMGESDMDARDADVDVIGWARFDATAALRQLLDLVGDAPVTWIGHSLGGQIVPFVPDHGELSRVLTIAAGSGYWKDNVPALRRKVWLLWYVLVPLLTPLVGYFPGKRLGMVGNIPRRVMEQWRHWCLDRNYAVGYEGSAVAELFGRVKTPVVSIAFTEDEMLSQRNIEALHECYTSTTATMIRIVAADVGQTKIGHFGFFKPSMISVWPALVESHLAQHQVRL